jgi:hypothetical protein
MIYLDTSGHLVTDGDIEELHEFAENLGLKREWFQDHRHPHYDCTTERMRQKAWRRGARKITPREVIEILRG